MITAERDLTEGASRTAVAVGMLTGLATFAFLMIGAQRAFDLDDSITVGLFVRTPSITDAFTTPYVLNNQVGLSFIEHVVYSVTGAHSELAMRFLPIVFAASAVGTLAGLVARHWGVLAACVAAAVLATNPTFADVGSQVRGYGLLTLLAIVTTATILRSLEEGTASNTARVIYACLGVIGVATHLYMLVVLAIHAVICLSDRKVLQRWIIPWVASLIGLGAYARLWRPMRATADTLGRHFRVEFPRDLGVALLGSSVLATLLLLIVVVPVVWRVRRNRIVRFAAVGILLAITTVWVIAPFDLYPRFLLWLAPLTALAAAAAVRHDRRWALLIAVIVVVQLTTVWPRLTEDPIASAQVASVFDRVRVAGGTPCVIDDFTTLRLLGYTKEFHAAASKSELAGCTVVASLDQTHGPGPARDADARFRYRAQLPARTNGILWSRVPTACWTEPSPEVGCSGTSDP